MQPQTETDIKRAVFNRLVSSTFFIDARELIPLVEFTSIEHNIALLLGEFFDKYFRTPTREELLLQLSQLPEEERKFVKDYKTVVGAMYTPADVDEKYLLDQLREMATKSLIKQKITEVAKSFEIKTASEIMLDIQDLVVRSPTKQKNRIEVDVGDVKNNLKLIKVKHDERISTGMEGLDHCLYGGLGVRELMCFVARSGLGKSVLLINLMYNFILRSKNVLFISLEMGTVDVLRRLYRRILYHDKDQMISAEDKHMESWLNKFFKSSHASGKVVYFPANTFSAEDLRAEMVKLEMQQQFIPDVIIIDHLDLMTSRTKHIRSKEAHSFWRMVTDDLHTFILENNIPICSATQANRAASSKGLTGISEVGESLGKVQSSDIIISINQNDEEKERKRMRLAVLKNRDYLAGRIIELHVDLDLMMMVDVYHAEVSGLLKKEGNNVI